LANVFSATKPLTLSPSFTSQPSSQHEEMQTETFISLAYRAHKTERSAITIVIAGGATVFGIAAGRTFRNAIRAGLVSAPFLCSNRISAKVPLQLTLRMRRFPAPWTVEAIDAGFKIIDANGQVYVYGYANPRDAGVAKALTLDEARRIASNIAKLPNYLAAN
jgi:hypothetical protein